MENERIHNVRLDLIDTQDRLRQIDAARVEVLMDSILARRDLNAGATGLDTPITVRPMNQGYKLVAGGHRLEAIRRLGDTEISAFVRSMTDNEARLAEIDENLARVELTMLDRAAFLSERDAIWRELHPERSHGKSGANARWHHATEKFSFASDVAEKAGLTDRAIRADVKMFRSLAATPEVLAQIRGTWIADHQSQLKSLAKLGPDERLKVARVMTRPEKPAVNVAAALGEITGQRETDFDPDEHAFLAFVKVWEHASARTRSRIVDHLKATGALKGVKAATQTEEEAA